jgi:hypothetical protein
MLTFITVLILWYIVGLSTNLYRILKLDQEDILVKDIPHILLLSVHGPIVILIILCFMYKDTVILKGKKE